MTKSPLSLFDPIMVGPFLAYLNVYASFPVPEFIFLLVLAVSVGANNNSCMDSSMASW